MVYQYLNSDLLLFTAPTRTAIEQGFVNGLKPWQINLKGYYCQMDRNAYFWRHTMICTGV